MLCKGTYAKASVIINNSSIYKKYGQSVPAAEAEFFAFAYVLYQHQARSAVTFTVLHLYVSDMPLLPLQLWAVLIYTINIDSIV